MKEEVIDYIQNLKEQGTDVRTDEDQINDLIKRIFNKKEKIDKEKNVFINFLDKYKYDTENTY